MHGSGEQEERRSGDEMRRCRIAALVTDEYGEAENQIDTEKRRTRNLLWASGEDGKRGETMYKYNVLYVYARKTLENVC